MMKTSTIAAVGIVLHERYKWASKIRRKAEETIRKHPDAVEGSKDWRRMRNNLQEAEARCEAIEAIQQDLVDGLNEYLRMENASVRCALFAHNIFLTLDPQKFMEQFADVLYRGNGADNEEDSNA